MRHRIFTSESVTEGHPDKVCDQISDGILDAILAEDPMARVACEAIVTTGVALVMGEISTTCYADIPAVVRRTIRRVGYDRAELGFNHQTCAVFTSIDEQSPDIAMGVDHALDGRDSADDDDRTGAGDQGMMFGFACDETPELMPAPISLAHALTRRLAEARRVGALPFLRPDGKSQVTVVYDDAGRVARVGAVVVSTQHDDIGIETVREGVMEAVIRPVIPPAYLDKDTKIFINPTGR
ncbi:MAG: methionine adenosyltransferase, partial [Oscillospiraceae bacterium]|nr:methionine adenosyltransferase [Oscillospiraceae bacterium]